MQQRVLVQPRPRAEPAGLGRQVVGRDGVLKQCLDAGDHDPRPAAAPGRERRDPGGRLVGDQLAPFVGERGPRLQRGDGLRVAQPRPELLGDAVTDLGVAGDPHEPLPGVSLSQGRREVGLGAVRNRDQPDVATDPSAVVVGATEPLAERPERPGLREQGRQRRQVGQAVAAAGPAVRPRVGRRALLRLRGARLGRLEVVDLRVHLGHVEVDLGRLFGGTGEGVPCRELLGDLLGDATVAAAAAAERRRRRLRHPDPPSAAGHVASRSWSCARRPAPVVRRPHPARRAGRHRPVGARTC